MALWLTRSRHRAHRIGAALCLVAALVALCATSLVPTVALAQQRPTANAQIKDASGRVLATAELREGSSEVIVLLSLPSPAVLSGVKALHIHEHGRCDPPDFSSAGGIFNPFNRQHGLKNRNGPMVGDLPNVLFTSGGLSSYNASANLASLSPGQGSLLDADGSALVMFSDIDDGTTQPEGNAGSRIGCGVISAGAAPASAAAQSAAPPLGVPTPTPRPTVASPLSAPTATPAPAARTATPAPAGAAAKPGATVPPRPTVSATLTAFALSVGKPGAPAAQPNAATKPSPVVPVVSTGQQPVAAAQPTLAAAQQIVPPTQAAQTSQSNSAPPAALIAGLGIVLLGAGFAVGRLRRG